MYEENGVQLDDVFEGILEKNFNLRFTNFQELGSGAGSTVYSAFD